MALPSGWARVRNWLVPLGYLVARAAVQTEKPGARQAIKQPLVAAAAFNWFAQTDQCEPVTSSLTTNSFHLGRYGFDRIEQIVLLNQTGSEIRILELINWVNLAHKRLKMLILIGCGEEPSVQLLQDAHEPTIKKLAQILEQAAEVPSGSLATIRGYLHREVPGLIFPQVASERELEELIAATRNINLWLAQHGTFACSCRALPTFNLP